MRKSFLNIKKDHIRSRSKRGDCFDLVQVEFVQPLRLRNTEGAWRVIVNGIHVYRSGSVNSVNHRHHAIIITIIIIITI